MQISKKVIALLGIGLLILGIVLSNFWHGLNNPMKPLYVEVVNDTDKLIPSVIIEHGRSGLQEKITLVQLRPKESRVLALNHKPGMGFNIHVNFANGTETEICAGKNKGYWFFRETITKFGVYSTPVR
jgi:hypothetical protein